MRYVNSWKWETISQLAYDFRKPLVKPARTKIVKVKVMKVNVEQTD